MSYWSFVFGKTEELRPSEYESPVFLKFSKKSEAVLDKDEFCIAGQLELCMHEKLQTDPGSALMPVTSSKLSVV